MKCSTPTLRAIRFRSPSSPPLPDNPLLNLRLPNFILTPHTAWASGEAMQKLADILIGNVEAFERGAPTNVVA